MSSKEVIKDLVDELAGLADSFGNYVGSSLSDKTIHIDDDVDADEIDFSDE